MSAPAYQDDLQEINERVTRIWEGGRQYGQQERESQFFGQAAAILTARMFEASLREAAASLRAFSAEAADFFTEESERFKAFVTPPEIRSHDPADGATGIVLNGSISAQFVRPINEETLTDETFYIGAASGGPHLNATIHYDEHTLTATLTPENELSPNTEYKVTLDGVRAPRGLPLEPAVSFSFTTAGA